MMKINILILEDDPLIAIDLSQILLEENYNVTIVSNYHDAFEKCNLHKYDLFICDINLGDGPSGIKFIEDYLSINNDFGVIYISAYSNIEILRKAEITKPINYILKPWNDNQVKVAIRIAIDQIVQNRYSNKIIHSLNSKNINLEKINQNKDLFTSLALHDIRSPLRFYKNVIQSIKSEYKKKNIEISDKLNLLDDTSSQLYFLSDDLLNIFLTNKDKHKFKLDKVCVSDLLIVFSKTYAKQFLSNGNSLKVDVNDNIYIETDANIFISIVRNVFDNANKYTFNGVITIKLFKNQNNTILILKDNGVGFDFNKNNIENIANFGLFFISHFSKILGLKYEYNTSIGNGCEFVMNFNQKI